MPNATRFAFLVDPNAGSAADTSHMEAAASAIGRQLEVLTASNNREIETAFASLMQRRTDALLVPSQVLFNNRVVQLSVSQRTIASPRSMPGATFPMLAG